MTPHHFWLNRFKSGHQSIIITWLVTGGLTLILGFLSLAYLGWWGWGVVLSDSMLPTIPAGSLLFHYRQSEYQLDQVVVFRDFSNSNPSRHNSRLVVHRIVGVVKDGLESSAGHITQGDNNATPDLRVVTAPEIKGRVLAWLPGIGFPIWAIKTSNQAWKYGLGLLGISLLSWLGSWSFFHHSKLGGGGTGPQINQPERDF